MGILDLADELLRIILEHISQEPEKLISLERRAYLSQESFQNPTKLEPDQTQNIARFRLTCRRCKNLCIGTARETKYADTVSFVSGRHPSGKSMAYNMCIKLD
jgi:hypothetical protein